MQLLSDIPQRTLAIYAHPNDAELSCGGTLAKWAEAGAAVGLLLVSAGDKGAATGVPDDDLVAHRRSEVHDAAQALGVEVIDMYGYLDGEFENTLELRHRLTASIRMFAPNTVITHDPTMHIFGDVYINHRDHRVTGVTVLDVVQASVSNPKYFPGTNPHSVSDVLLTATDDANIAVDIAQTIPKKVAAMSAHRSQLPEGATVGDVVSRRASADARGTQAKAAEVFRRLRIS